MKKEKMCEVNICDICQKEVKYVYVCLGCGKDICWECDDKEGRTLQHSVNASGSGDGFFCNNCIANPPEKIKELLSAYMRIQALRNESDMIWEDFRKRKELAEKEIMRLRGGVPLQRLKVV